MTPDEYTFFVKLFNKQRWTSRILGIAMIILGLSQLTTLLIEVLR